jgi:hypothetical protein
MVWPFKPHAHKQRTYTRVREGDAGRGDWLRDRGNYRGASGQPEDEADMQEADRRRAMVMSRRMFHSSSAYGAVIDRFLDHVVGDGVQVVVDDEATQDWLTEQLARPENRWNETLGQRLTRLVVDGEFIQTVTWPTGPGGKPLGDFYLGRLDLDGLAGLDVHPLNHDAITAIDYSRSGSRITIPIITTEPGTEWHETEIAGHDASVGAQFFRARTIGLRSGPLLSRIVDKANEQEDLFTNLMRKAEYLNRFWGHITYEGAKAPDFDSKYKSFEEQAAAWFESLVPGQALVTSAGVKVSVETPDLKMTDAQALYDISLDLILGAYAIPRSWFSSGGDTNKATAQEQQSPIGRYITSFQQNELKPAIEDLMRFLIWLGAEAGVPGVKADAEVTVVMSSLSGKDGVIEADEAQRALILLDDAERMGVISGEEKVDIARGKLGAMSYGEWMSDEGAVEPTPVDDVDAMIAALDAVPDAGD